MNIPDHLPGAEHSADSQRIQVFTEKAQVKICLERFDQQLGWYTAGSLVLPLSQAALLQQTLQNVGTDAASLQAANIISLTPYLNAFPA